MHLNEFKSQDIQDKFNSILSQSVPSHKHHQEQWASCQWLQGWSVHPNLGLATIWFI